MLRREFHHSIVLACAILYGISSGVLLSGHTAWRQKEPLAVVRKCQLCHYRSDGFKVPENIYSLFCYKFTENLMAKKIKLFGQHLGMLRVRMQWEIRDSECMANGQLWRCRV